MADILIADNGDGGDIVLRDPIYYTSIPELITVVSSGDEAGDYFYAGGRRWENGDYTIVIENSIWKIIKNENVYLISGDGTRVIFGRGRDYILISENPDTVVSTVSGSDSDSAPPHSGWTNGVALGYEDLYFPRTDNADIYKDDGIGTAVYISLFDEVSWYEGLKASSERVDGAGGLMELINQPITVGSVARMKQQATRQLSWLKSEGFVSEIEVAVSNPAVGKVEIEITAYEPSNTTNTYKYMWDQHEQTITGDRRSQKSVIEETLWLN